MPDFTMLEHLRRPWSFDEPEVREWAALRIESLESKLDTLTADLKESEAHCKALFDSLELATTKLYGEEAIRNAALDRATAAETRLNAATLALLSIRNTPPLDMTGVGGRSENWWYSLVEDMRTQASEAFEAGKSSVVERQWAIHECDCGRKFSDEAEYWRHIETCSYNPVGER